MPARLRIPHLVLLATLMAGAGPAYSQLYNIHTYRELDGLPSSTVYSLVQDDDGSLWIATARGLTRYDGHHWEPQPSLGRGPVTQVLYVDKDEQGRIWAVARDHETIVAVRDQEQWRTSVIPPDPARQASLIAFDLGRTASGTTLLAAATRLGEVLVTDGAASRLLKLDRPHLNLHAIRFADEGLLVATDQGLFVLDTTTWEFRRTALPGPVAALCPAGEGRWWFVGPDWIGQGTPAAVTVLASGLDLTLDIPSAGVVAVAGPVGGIYFGDIGQVHYFHPDFGLEYLSRDNGLVSAGATDFLVDREGLVWVASLRGISKLATRSLAGFDSRHGLYDDEVSAIAFLGEGRAALGHIGGVTIVDDGHYEVRPFGGDNTIGDRVTDLAVGPDGRLWFAADKMGIGWIGADGEMRFEGGRRGYPPAAYALLFDRAGTQWVGTFTGPLRRRADGSLEPVDLPVPAGENVMVRRLVEGRDGTIYVASGYHGLFAIRDAGAVRFPMPESFSGQVYDVCETMDGAVLVGTVEGLFTVRGDSLVRAGVDWPAITRPVYAITDDGRGGAWFGTDNGLLHWDGDAVSRLGRRDGLLGAEINRDALKFDPHGDLWIGTDRGLNIYRPAFDRAPAAAPLAGLTSVKADGEAYPVAGPVRLARPPRLLEFTFRGIAFRDETLNRYQTWLESFDEGWQPAAVLPGHEVRYTNLAPGTYRFHVRVEGADGQLSPVASSGEIRIAPALVDRWWVRVLAVLAILVLGWILASNVASRRYAIRLKRQVGERTASLEMSESRFRGESQRLAATLGSISDGVVTLDRDGLVVLCNAAAQRTLGRGDTDLVGHAWPAVVQVSPPLQLDADDSNQAHEYRKADGHSVWLEFSVAPLTDRDGTRVGQVLAFRDITGRRELENQRLRSQQLESLGVLAGGIAHDFNNLLTIILGNISLVEDSPVVREGEKRRLDQMKSAIENARALTDQFLTFARGGDPKLEPASLVEVVRQAATLAFSGATATYRLELEDGLWPVVIDRGQIIQVLNNLLLNARQAMADGGCVVIAARNCPRCGDFPSGSGCVRLDVTDQGEGIPLEDLERIFEPYYTTKDTGTGLGLAIAHSIVRRHGGILSVRSQTGRGSVFTLALPAADVAVLSEPVPDAAASLAAGRVLVLEDEAEVRDVCRGLLESLGLDFVGAPTGEDALRAYAAAQAAGQPFDAVIMDLTVPGAMGGKEAVRRLLEADPAAKVIVASGYSRDPVLANYTNYGFIAALRKPFGREALRAVLAVVIGTSADANP